MVVLTMTPTLVAALKARKARSELAAASAAPRDPDSHEDEPSLQDPSVGNPITHGQIIDLWKDIQYQQLAGFTLEKLLIGARLYKPPPPPKPEPSDEYKVLMARLRHEEEERKYQRMVSKPSPTETLSQRHPHAAMAKSFAEVNRPVRESDMGDNDVTYNDTHRQLVLLLNFVLSIIGSAATLWILARWWSTPARLLLTMGGTLLVAIAEVVLYNSYIWHLETAKKKEKSFKEVKQVVQTWSVGGEVVDGETDEKLVPPQRNGIVEVAGVKKRIKPPA